METRLRGNAASQVLGAVVRDGAGCPTPDCVRLSDPCSCLSSSGGLADSAGISEKRHRDTPLPRLYSSSTCASDTLDARSAVCDCDGGAAVHAVAHFADEGHATWDFRSNAGFGSHDSLRSELKKVGVQRDAPKRKVSASGNRRAHADS